MKSLRWQLSLRGILAVVYILLPDIPGAGAQSNSDVTGLAVGISLVTSVITTLLTILIVYCIKRATSRKNRNSKLKRDAHERQSDASNATTRPLVGGPSRSISYEPVNPDGGQNGDVRNNMSRIKSDFIAKWCTEQRLTEYTASILRSNGFTTKQAVESLRIEDIPRLGLKNIAQECILREILVSKQKLSTSTGSGVFPRQRSNSEENIQVPLMKEHNHSGNSSVFERSQSVHDMVDGGLVQGPSLRKKRSVGSMEIIENDQDGEAPTIIIYNRSNSKPQIHEAGPGLLRQRSGIERKSNPKNFRGLLSDQGLYDLAGMIGVEWNHLGTLLGISNPVQEQIKMDFPNNTRQQVFELFRTWRDNAVGNKEAIKGRLHKALVKVGRTDLAEDLLQEQVDGSCEKVTHDSIV